MSDIDTIGLLETSSIGLGFLVEDAMLKAAPVELLLARTICSGKYLIAIAGDTASVEAAVAAGEATAGHSCIEARSIPRVHPSVFPAISMAAEINRETARALGIVETYSASSIIDVADAAAKTSNVILFRIHLAMAIGGKGFVLLTGDVADVEAGVEAGAAVAASEGILVSKVIIARPRAELFHDWI